MKILKIAEITQTFLDKVNTLVRSVVFQTPAYHGNKKYVTVYKVSDPKGVYKDYYYTERFGRDSVAFLLWDRVKGYGILKSYSSPYKGFISGAFTGSLDKPVSKEQIVIEEVQEEAGYTIQESEIQFLGSARVGSNTNETVYLYVINVNDLEQNKKQPENDFEANTEIQWYKKNWRDGVENDWRAYLIVTRHQISLNEGN